MDLTLWAQLNMVGNVSYGDYLKMTPEEAKAAYAALNQVIDQVKRKQEREGKLDAIAEQFKRGR